MTIACFFRTSVTRRGGYAQAQFLKGCPLPRGSPVPIEPCLDNSPNPNIDAGLEVAGIILPAGYWSYIMPELEHLEKKWLGS